VPSLVSNGSRRLRKNAMKPPNEKPLEINKMTASLNPAQGSNCPSLVKKIQLL
jgi:hypothetical protein